MCLRVRACVRVLCVYWLFLRTGNAADVREIKDWHHRKLGKKLASSGERPELINAVVTDE